VSTPPHLICIAWGELPHPDCPVIVRSVDQVAPHVLEQLGELPAVCPCECKTCKRAWWADGRPRIVGGRVERG